MRKEFIIAIISGVAIGVLVAFGIWRANSAFDSKNEAQTGSPSSNSTNSTTSVESDQLTIAQPEDNDVTTSSPIKVTGITKPGLTLVISGEEEDYIVASANDGSFEQEVELVGGVNEIIVAHPANGDTAETKTVTVVFSSEFEKELSQNE